MKIIIDKGCSQLGIQVVAILVKNPIISNKNSLLEKKKKEFIEKLTLFDVNNPILQGYKNIYLQLSKAGIPPAENLLQLVQKNKRLPNINTFVDSYNLISLHSFLSIGAHDVAKIQGDLRFVITDGSEKYTPLGSSVLFPVSAGEYACRDSEKIICRMDVKQCDATKITKDSKEILIYIQGNKNTPPSYLQQALRELCDLLQEICGGEYEDVVIEYQSY